MTANYFDSLEAELRAAVPGASRRRFGPRRPPRWLPRPGVVLSAIGLAVTVAVVVLFAPLAGPRRTPVHPPALRYSSGGGGYMIYGLGSVPTLKQLLDNFAVLRRPQTAQDRSWHPSCDCGSAARQLNNLTRFATATGGYRVFLDVEQFLLGGQLNMAAGSYVLNLDIVDRRGNVSSTTFGPNVQYTIYPLSSGGPAGRRGGQTSQASVWASVVPDGVATVSWTLGCPRGRAAASPCGVRPQTFVVPVVNNVAARQMIGIASCLGRCASQITWRSSNGGVVASFGGFGNLPAPPFVTGLRGNGVLRLLHPDGIGSARFGQRSSSAIQTIQQLLGAPADTNVSAGSCGIDHESVWTSPTVADPLTIFQQGGRFVGYQYGAPVWQIGLRQGPGPVLASLRGLTPDETVADGTRLYGARFMTSAKGGGTWRATGDGGVIRGAVLPITYPLREVSAKNRIATIDAGAVSCPPSPSSTSGTSRRPPVASVDAARRLLQGNGIGSVTFGQPRATVIAVLERLLGPPHETISGICGFGRSTDWIGLNSDLTNPSAELNLDFKHSRFVGYGYSANAEGPAPQRHGVVLGTTRGLTLGDTVARARHLYGRAFIETRVPQGTPPSAKLPRLPVGEVRTASGTIFAGIQGFGRRDRVTPDSTVVLIRAGAGPNTPCR